MKDKFEIDVLGTIYTVERKKYNDDEHFKNKNWAAYCDSMFRKIVLGELSTFKGFENETVERCTALEKDNLRHEIVHAFLNESGLKDSSLVLDGGWAVNEEMVDWIAIQSPKIFKVFDELELFL